MVESWPDFDEFIGENENTIEDSAMPRPSLTAFINTAESAEDVLEATVDKNMLSDVEAS